MTDNEIIKALECCKVARLNQDCLDLKCPFSTEYGCDIDAEDLRNEALDLINRQQEEIKSLTEKLEALGDPLQDAHYKIAEQQTEIEILTGERNCLAKMEHDNLYEQTQKIRKAKSKAIKEFAERYEKIKADRIICSDCHYKYCVDNLVKEMTEPQKIDHNSLCETDTYEVKL